MPEINNDLLIKDITICKDIYDLDEVIDALPDCTFKGYLVCKLEIFSDSSDNVKSAKEMLLKTIKNYK